MRLMIATLGEKGGTSTSGAVKALPEEGEASQRGMARQVVMISLTEIVVCCIEYQGCRLRLGDSSVGLALFYRTGAKIVLL